MLCSRPTLCRFYFTVKVARAFALCLSSPTTIRRSIYPPSVPLVSHPESDLSIS